MSAIAGALFLDDRPYPGDLLARMIDAAPPRGLDGATTWQSGSAGMIRFANVTTPESVGEKQPFASPSGAIALFDGRLDNRGELIDLLGPSGRALRQAPDGEIALALYDKLGRDFVRRLVGDFAIAIHEPVRRRLSLFCSPLGWRPLVWTFDGKIFAFATDARTLVVGLGLERRLNEGALGEFLSGRFLTRTETFWANIQRVEQGGAIILENNRVEEWPWHGGPYEDWCGRSMKEHSERFRELFDQALVAVNRSNGPVTSQLSGGLDSSSIVCRSAELYRDGGLAWPVGAITARFPGEPHDESPWSRAVEEHSGIAAEVARSRPFSLEEAQTWTARTYQLPIRPNALDTLAGVVNLLKADGRRVMLTGEGGDDWLNGSLAHWPDLMLSGHWGDLLHHGRYFWPDDSQALCMLKTLVSAARPIVIPRYRTALMQPALDWRIPDSDWLMPEWMKQINLADRWKRPIGPRGIKGFAQHSRYAVYTHGNRQIIAATAMAYAESHGIEVRHPFHDARISSFAMGASGVHMRDKIYRKKILREAMRGTLPELVRMRTDKAMFVGHTVDAIDTILAHRAINDMLPVRMGWVNGKRIEQLHAPFSKWRRDGSQGPLPRNPWGPVWYCIATDIWMQHAFGL
nr:asparagine synthase-related protein [uncultured Rhodoferax sp.]